MIHIQPLESQQLESIAVLARRIWPVSYANILTPEQINNLLGRIYSLENLRGEMQSGHRFFIAMQHSQAIGYASAYQDGSVLWLKKLYVLPEMQGQGIGKELMQAALDAFPLAEEIRLLVNRDNLPAQQFYLRQRFTQTGEVAVQMGDFQFVDFVFSKTIAT